MEILPWRATENNRETERDSGSLLSRCWYIRRCFFIQGGPEQRESTVTFRIVQALVPRIWLGMMASARDKTGYTLLKPLPQPCSSYDHKINVWGSAGGGQTWRRINTYITAIKLLLRPHKTAVSIISVTTLDSDLALGLLPVLRKRLFPFRSRPRTLSPLRLPPNSHFRNPVDILLYLRTIEGLQIDPKAYGTIIPKRKFIFQLKRHAFFRTSLSSATWRIQWQKAFRQRRDRCKIEKRER